jgi:hypothetical protein
MATHNKIGRLTERIETLARRRRGKLTAESLTDEGWAKIERCAAEREQSTTGEPILPHPEFLSWSDDAARHFSDDALLHILIEGGILEPGDFKRTSAARNETQGRP